LRNHSPGISNYQSLIIKPVTELSTSTSLGISFLIISTPFLQLTKQHQLITKGNSSLEEMMKTKMLQSKAI